MNAMMDAMDQAKQALQQPLISAPGQQAMYWAGDTSDPMKVLDQVDALAIQEQVKGMELLTGFETGNKYMVRDLKTGANLFLAMETNDGAMGTLQRNALSGSNRGFNLKIGMLKGPEVAPERFATLARPFKCTLCCYGRPVTVISDPRTGASLGGIIEPFAPCQIKLVQFDNQGQPAGEVDECCTKMCCFGCPCKQEVDFPIKKDGRVMATIRKQFTAMNAIGAVTGLATDTDHFTLHFEKGLTAQDKLHAISTTLFMDFAYFTKGGAEQRQGSGAAMLGQAEGGSDGLAMGALFGALAGGAAAAYSSSQQQDKRVEW